MKKKQKTPTPAEHLRAISQLGVAAKAAKRAERASWLEWPLVDGAGRSRAIASFADGEIVSSWVAEMIAKGRLSATDGKVITIAANAWAKMRTGGDMAKRLATVEKQVASLQKTREEAGSPAQRQRIAELERQIAAPEARRPKPPREQPTTLADSALVPAGPPTSLDAADEATGAGDVLGDI